MAGFTRRGFVKASGALAAVPALAAVSARAQGPAPDIGNLRAEKDIVFGKAGDMDMTLDVYRPPVGVTSKRTAIIHLFGGGFFVGNKNAGYIINDAKALGARGYTSVSANYRLQTQGSWPAQIHDTKAAIRWTRANAERLGVDSDKIVIAGYSAGGMLSLMAAASNGRADYEGNVGTPGVSSDVNAAIGVYPLASAETARGLWPEGQATDEAVRDASPNQHITASHAPTIFIHQRESDEVLERGIEAYHAGQVDTARQLLTP